MLLLLLLLPPALSLLDAVYVMAQILRILHGLVLIFVIRMLMLLLPLLSICLSRTMEREEMPWPLLLSR